MTRTAIERVFLDWRRPGLVSAAAFLVERYARPGALDLSGVLVAVPGARAGRRLLELLVEQSEERGLTLTPPRVLTAGGLPEQLYKAKWPFASGPTQELAWVEALRQSPAEERRLVIRREPDADDRPGWLALGRLLAQVHRELAADGHHFDDVAALGGRLPGFTEQPRWQALAAIQRRYLKQLDALELWDQQTARLHAIEHRECESDCQIVLVGMVDMNLAQRQMLDLVAPQATALVLAPESMADRFDEHGCLKPERWADVRLEIPAERMRVADGPGEQADEVLRALARLGGRHPAEDIVVGAADEELVPYLLDRLAGAGVPARYGAGRDLPNTGPCRLLGAMADWLDSRSYRALAALVRHPDLTATGMFAGAERHDWLTPLDQYHAKHLPVVLDGDWPDEAPRDGKRSQDVATLQQVKRLYRAVGEWLRPLEGRARPLAEWGPRVFDALLKVYAARPLDTADPAARFLKRVFEGLDDAWRTLAEVPPALAGSVTATEAIRAALDLVARETVPPPRDDTAVEVLGWLELPLDDAPVLFVAGFNEGRVPASRGGDPFLPDGLRRALALEDNARRYARDAYALGVLLASRAELLLVAGRRTAAGDPLWPSRLLMACDDEQLPERVRALFQPGAADRAAAALPGRLRATRDRSVFAPPELGAGYTPKTKMRVTEFRDYLACPYRYYLRHVAHLEPLDDAAVELDAGGFGELLHEVLMEFARGPASRSLSEGEIFAALEASLADLVGRRFKRQAAPAVYVQVEQARARLRAFAAWQARTRAEGWETRHVEQTLGGPSCALVVDGEPMQLSGRIDRIDFHPATGMWRVLDYKTGDSVLPPEKTHRASDDTWTDLQLPLYRHLLAALQIERPVELGYLPLPKDTSGVKWSDAPWTEADLASADAAAAEVIRGVRAGRFAPRASPPPAFSEPYADICHEGSYQDVPLDSDDEGGS